MEPINVKVTITGVVPLILHNGALADPLNDIKKAIDVVAKKKPRTDADLEEMGRLEFAGSLYMGETGPILPAMLLEATIVAGAKKARIGPQAKAGALVKDHAQLVYDGPRTVEKLWRDKRFVSRAVVRVMNNKLVRTRPIFPKWSATFEVVLLPDLLDLESLRRAIDDAGRVVGLGDWRPRHGRFDITKFEVVDESILITTSTKKRKAA